MKELQAQIPETNYSIIDSVFHLDLEELTATSPQSNEEGEFNISCMDESDLKTTVNSKRNHLSLKLRNENRTKKKCGRKQRLEKSIIKQPKAGVYPCPYCEKSFIIQPNMKRHIQIIHTKETCVYCPICQCKLRDQCNLDVHLLVNHFKNMFKKKGQKNYKCMKCSTDFSLRKQIASHILRFHHEEKFSIAENMEFVEIGLDNPESISLENKNDEERLVGDVHHRLRQQCRDLDKKEETPVFMCAHCLQVYSNKNDLSDHIKRLHKMKEMIADCVVCGCKFIDKYKPNKHTTEKHDSEYILKETKSGKVIRNFMCQCCEMTFSKRDSLFTHFLSQEDMISNKRENRSNSILKSISCDGLETKEIGNFQSYSLESCAVQKISESEDSCTECPNTFNPEFGVHKTEDFEIEVVGLNDPSLLSLNINDSDENRGNKDGDKNLVTRFQCVQCPEKRRFSEAHISETIETETVCILCNDKFTNKHLMNEHILNMHCWDQVRTIGENGTLEINYKCPICAMEFSLPAELSIHFQHHLQRKYIPDSETEDLKKIVESTSITHLDAGQPDSEAVDGSKTWKSASAAFSDPEIYENMSIDAVQTEIIEKYIDLSDSDPEDMHVPAESNSVTSSYPKKTDVINKKFVPKLDDSLEPEEIEIEVVGWNDKQFSKLANVLDKKNFNKYARQFECSLCPDVFSNEDTLYKHILGKHFWDKLQTFKHGVTKFMCPCCQLDFLTRSELFAHILQGHTRSLRKFHTMGKLTEMLTPEEKFSVGLEKSDRKMATREDMLQCAHCGVKFWGKWALIRHIKSTHLFEPGLKIAYKNGDSNRNGDIYGRENKFECPDCNKKYQFKFSLKRHIKTSHPLEKPDCPLCLCRFLSKAKLYTHMLDIHCGENYVCLKNGIQLYKCPCCALEFVLQQELFSHLEMHRVTEPVPICSVGENKGNKYRCSHCGKEIMYKNKLFAHILRKHKNFTRYTCKTCGKKYFRKCDLTRHMESNHSTQSFTCPRCLKTIRSEYAFHRHITRVHASKKKIGNSKTCVECKESFLTKGDFVLHMIQFHRSCWSDDEKQDCNSDRDFSSRNKKSSRNSRELDFECPDCNRKFASDHSLSVHIKRTHQNVCQLCDAKFYYKRDLSNHIELFHSKKNAQCSFCSKIMKRSQLFEHIIDLHASLIKSRRCRECKVSFASKDQFVSHILQLHIKSPDLPNQPLSDDDINNENSSSSHLESEDECLKTTVLELDDDF